MTANSTSQFCNSTSRQCYEVTFYKMSQLFCKQTNMTSFTKFWRKEKSYSYSAAK